MVMREQASGVLSPVLPRPACWREDDPRFRVSPLDPVLSWSLGVGDFGEMVESLGGGA